MSDLNIYVLINTFVIAVDIHCDLVSVQCIQYNIYAFSPNESWRGKARQGNCRHSPEGKRYLTPFTFFCNLHFIGNIVHVLHN